jgi:uncharacterized phage protein (TIGR01671 family)
MIPKLRAWDKVGKSISSVSEITYSGDLSYLSFVKLSGNNRLYGPESRLADDVIIMQSTGLKDKNGVEIYEGDVIANQNKEPENWYISHHEVVWHDTGFMGKQICSSGSYIGLNYWTSGENGYVVIGNIYENPELLEGAAR